MPLGGRGLVLFWGRVEDWTSSKLFFCVLYGLLKECVTINAIV